MIRTCMLLLCPVLAAAGTALAASGSAAAGPEDNGDAPWLVRVYDLRDVGAALPRARPATPELGDAPAGAIDGFAVSAVSRDDEGAAAGGDPLDLLVQRLGESLGVAVMAELTDGIYLCEAPAADHDRFTTQIRQLRSMFGTTRAVRLTLARTSPRDAPDVGDALPATTEVMTRFEQNVPERVPTVFRLARAQHYVASWIPVVADSAVAYQPRVGTIRDGVDLDVTLHATDDGGFDVRLVGTLASANLATHSATPDRADAPELALELPRIEERSVDARAKLLPGRATVVALVPALDEETLIVVAIAVRE